MIQGREDMKRYETLINKVIEQTDTLLQEKIPNGARVNKIVEEHFAEMTVVDRERIAVVMGVVSSMFERRAVSQMQSELILGEIMNEMKGKEPS